jgi:hypothetical protein
MQNNFAVSRDANKEEIQQQRRLAQLTAEHLLIGISVGIKQKIRSGEFDKTLEAYGRARRSQASIYT